MTQDINLLRLDKPATRDGLDAAARRDDLNARRVAAEFEALLLTQLTASLNPSEEDGGEESLFGGGPGAGVYRQLFSEQIAGAISRAGGVGMADVILGQIRPEALRAESGAGRETRHAIAVARLVRGINATGVAAKAPDSAASINTPARTSTGREKITKVATETETKDDVYLVSEAAPSDAVPTPDVALPTGASAFAGATPARLAPATRPRRVFPVSSADKINDAVNPVTKTPRRAEPTELRMPIQGRLSSRFGIRRDPIHGHHRFHRGMDIAAPRGTPIGAAGEGTVVFAGHRKGYGNTVIVEHPDGRQTRYAHADRLYVKRGDTVNAGEVIAAVGSTGRSTGPHLHFEVVENGRRVNPLSILTNEMAVARR